MGTMFGNGFSGNVMCDEDDSEEWQSRAHCRVPDEPILLARSPRKISFTQSDSIHIIRLNCLQCNLILLDKVQSMTVLYL